MWAESSVHKDGYIDKVIFRVGICTAATIQPGEEGRFSRIVNRWRRLYTTIISLPTFRQRGYVRARKVIRVYEWMRKKDPRYLYDDGILCCGCSIVGIERSIYADYGMAPCYTLVSGSVYRNGIIYWQVFGIFWICYQVWTICVKVCIRLVVSNLRNICVFVGA